MRFSSVLAVAALGAAAAMVHAQTPTGPVVLWTMPTGGQAGTSFALKVTGQNMEGVEGLHFDFPGAVVEVLGSEKAAPAAEMKRPGGKAPGGQLTQQFKVTLPKDAPLGIHDLRLISKSGISNPRAFVVGDRPEILETEPNDDLPKAQRIALDTSVDGVITTPTDVDYFVFTGKKGQRVVCSCLSSSIDSKLLAAIQLYSAAGKYLGFGRGYHVNDAVVDATLPEDGDYYARVFGFSYTVGGPDCFYRLTISQAPWIDAVYPPVVEPGKDAKVTLIGRNLPGGKLDPQLTLDGRALEQAQVTIKAPSGPQAEQRLAYSGLILPSASALDGFEYRAHNEHGKSNPALVLFARAPVVLDNEANDTPETAQKLTLPCEIVGRIEKKADRDWYSFAARKGEVYSIEAFGERIGSPLDLQFVLRDIKGGLLTDQDDNPDVMSNQFYTRNDDPSRYRFTVPADGTYTLLITTRDSFTLFGPREIYAVRIAPESPDFRVIAMPPSLTTPEPPVVGHAGTFAFNLHIWRLDGFTGDIRVTADNLPPGVTIAPQTISASQKQGVIVASAAVGAAPWAGPIHLQASATVQGRKLVRDVRAASISWAVQQNIPALSRLDRELVLAVRGDAPYQLAAVKDKFSVPQGGSVTIPVKVKPLAKDFKASVQVDALGLPANFKTPTTTVAPDKEGNFVLDTKNQFPPGVYSLVLRGQTQAPKNNQQPPKNAPPNLVEYTTPVSLTVLPKQLAKLTVTPGQAKIQVGKETELIVRAKRDSDVPPTELKVEVVFPPNGKGLSAAPATIKADQEQVRVVINASPDVRPGIAPNLTIRATALFNGIPVVQETTVPLSVVK
jgi:hypothetical protein